MERSGSLEARDYVRPGALADSSTASGSDHALEPLQERWSLVRYRIDRIGEQLKQIESSLNAFDEAAAAPVLERLEGMQTSFECIMACLARFDAELDSRVVADCELRSAVDAAKHDFVRVAQRYQRSRWSRAKTSH